MRASCFNCARGMLVLQFSIVRLNVKDAVFRAEIVDFVMLNWGLVCCGSVFSRDCWVLRKGWMEKSAFSKVGGETLFPVGSGNHFFLILFGCILDKSILLVLWMCKNSLYAVL